VDLRLPIQVTPVQLYAVAILGAVLCAMLLALLPRIRWTDLLPVVRSRHLADKVPVPLWKIDASGRLLWANQAYRAVWGLADPPASEGRITVPVASGQRHFDVIRQGDIGQALPIDALIRTEADLRDMVQAMAKTFAQLPTGLAVFDRNRNLQSFNPALSDLTTLSPEFLSRRPSLVALLDRMRDHNMIPEPDNWKAWRSQIAEMERAAAHGQFEDVWSLPGGQTYRVTGRPHPDGGLALMIDDISSEIIRSRRYRAELELCQGVVDTLEDGIAVFASTGQLVMSNTAYTQLWGHSPGNDLAPTGIRHLAAYWRQRSAPTSFWAEAEDYMTTLDERDSRQAEVRLTDGRLIECCFFPLANGATLLRFRDITRGITPLALATAGG
jgi:PAS domain-containing protein